MIPALLLALALALPGAAQAHRGWMLPSATVLSGNEPWVTVDAASSTDIFYPDHNPMQIDGVVVIAPDGTPGTVENPARGRFRSVFDVKLAQKGTHKIALVTDTLFASWKAGAETKRVRGTAEHLAKEIPAGAQELRVTHIERRMEIFVTAGKPTRRVLEPTGKGLELVPLTHPNDLVVGETARFRFLLDGKPAAGLHVQVIPHGIRYRDRLEDQRLVTDASGEVGVKWAHPGMHWLQAAPPRAGDEDGPPPPGGTIEKPQRRTSYTTTLEVMSQ